MFCFVLFVLFCFFSVFVILFLFKFFFLKKVNVTMVAYGAFAPNFQLYITANAQQCGGDCFDGIQNGPEKG